MHLIFCIKGKKFYFRNIIFGIFVYDILKIYYIYIDNPLYVLDIFYIIYNLPMYLLLFQRKVYISCLLLKIFNQIVISITKVKEILF